MSQSTLTQLVNFLISSSYDAHKIVEELAKRDPSLFVELVNSTSEPKVPNDQIEPKPWVGPVIYALRNRGAIPAIKALRELKVGLGLREAKDIIDNLNLYRISVLVEKPNYNISSRDTVKLDFPSKVIFDELVQELQANKNVINKCYY